MISVIIPFFNAADTLPRLLTCLSIQSLPYTEFEVILVDNNSTDQSSAIIQAFHKTRPQFNIQCLCYCNMASSYGARNHGVRHAVGDILAFTDADCAPASVWLEEIATFFKNNQNCILSGHVELEIIDSKNIWEAFDKVAHMNNEKKAARACVATANMAVKRKDFLIVGFFKEVTSGGDYEWSQSVQSAGFNIKFHQTASVLHPTRKTKAEISIKLIRIANGQAELALLNGATKIKSTLTYALKTLFPLRLMSYSYGVYRHTGLIRSLSFFKQHLIISLKQIYTFHRNKGPNIE